MQPRQARREGQEGQALGQRQRHTEEEATQEQILGPGGQGLGLQRQGEGREEEYLEGDYQSVGTTTKAIGARRLSGSVSSRVHQVNIEGLSFWGNEW